MKSILIFSLVLLFAACSTNTETFKHSPADTSKTLALYHIGQQAKVDLVFRIAKDTFMFSAVDSLTTKKQWTRDTTYFVPIIDSARGLLFVPYPKEFILIDGGKNVDSLMKKFNLHFPGADSTKKK